METLLLATGMFRSGTSLLARLLGSHPQIAFAADAYQPLFKSFRNAVQNFILPPDKRQPDAPFHDYYFDPERNDAFRWQGRCSLGLGYSGKPSLSDLRSQIADYSREFSPGILPYLYLLDERTYKELLLAGFTIVNKAYGDEHTSVSGFKCTWINEYSSHVLNAFPRAKVIHIVRDPRAVTASRNVKDVKYPLLFLARQWRKLATISYDLLHHHAPFEGRVHVLRYEDLITQPEAEVRRLCDFLELDFRQSLLDPSSYKDGTGKPWRQNSSYSSDERGFNTQSLTKWKDVLAAEHVAFIERLCYAEMQLFGYMPAQVDSPDIPLDLVYQSPEIAEKELADWIAPFAMNDEEERMKTMALELFRIQALMSTKDFPREVKTRLCLSESMFDKIRNTLRDGS